MELFIKDISSKANASDRLSAPIPATAEQIASEMAGVPGTLRIVRLQKDATHWLEVGWIGKRGKSGFVFRENYEGKLYHSDDPIESTDEAAELVAQYLDNSVADIDEWFRGAFTSESDYKFITSRFWFELLNKRYRLKSFWSRTFVLVIWIPVMVIITLTGFGTFVPIAQKAGFVASVALLFAKFDFRGPKPKSKHAYRVSG